MTPRRGSDARRRLPPRALRGQAARTPDAVAVECEGARLTYGELDARAKRRRPTASASWAWGPRCWSASALERSPECSSACSAILKAGGAYVPLDPAYPAERAGLHARRLRSSP